MKFKILILLLIIIFFFLVKLFLSDFFYNKKEVHIVDKYVVLEVNGEYNLMNKEDHGYSLVVPSVSNVYTSQKEIIVVSNLEGNMFINYNYKSKYSTPENKYYYDIKQKKVQEISEEEFLKKIKNYNLVLQLK